MAEMYGMDFNTIKEVLKFPDDVDEDTAGAMPSVK